MKSLSNTSSFLNINSKITLIIIITLGGNFTISIIKCIFISIASVHKDLTLSEFKRIFYMEYIHRMWGRAIGLTFALPAGFFLLMKWVPKRVKPRLGFYAGIILFQVSTIRL